jgi:hypothetical protein
MKVTKKKAWNHDEFINNDQFIDARHTLQSKIQGFPISI